jgi:hypothetical protein
VAALVVLGACSAGGSKHATSSSTTSGLVTTPPGATASTAATPSSCSAPVTVAGSNSGPESSPPGDIPDNQAFVAYSPPDNLYAVRYPEGWARKANPAGVMFSDKLNAIDIAVVDAPAAPTVASVKTDDAARLAATTRCFELVDVTTVTRKAGAAVLVRFKADAAPDSVTGKVVRDEVERYAFWNNGKEVVLTLSAPAGSDNVDPWKIVTDSFTWR